MKKGQSLKVILEKLKLFYAPAHHPEAMKREDCYKLYRHYLQRTYAPMNPLDQAVILNKSLYWLERAQNAPLR